MTYPLPGDGVEKLLTRMCNAVYVCPTCGATVKGSDMRVDSHRAFSFSLDGSTLPTTTHCSSELMEILEETK